VILKGLKVNFIQKQVKNTYNRKTIYLGKNKIINWKYWMIMFPKLNIIQQKYVRRIINYQYKYSKQIMKN
jgi:hypothetical protein